jgi:hypothetical protein
LNLNNTAPRNTAVGYHALLTNATGEDNVAVGYGSLTLNTGYNNTAVGSSALYSNVNGVNNTAVGFQALFSNISGSSNVAVGYGALFTNTGSNNTAVGVNALQYNTTGLYNTAVGLQASWNNTTGERNVSIGESAGRFTTTGSNVICIGFDTNASSATASNETVIGNSDTVSAKIYGQPYQTIGSLVGSVSTNNTLADALPIDMKHSIYTITGDNGKNGYWYLPNPDINYAGCTINFRSIINNAANSQGWYITSFNGKTGSIAEMISYNQTSNTALTTTIRVIYSSQVVCMQNTFGVWTWYQTFTVNS